MGNTASKRVRASQMSPQKRRQQLLRAGVKSVVSHSIGGTKHAVLAAACEVSVPTVFSYFPNRERLIHSILAEVGESVVRNVMEPAQALPAAEQLQATALLFSDFANQEPDYVKAWLTWSMDFTPDIQAQYREVEEQLIGALVPMIQAVSSKREPEEDTRDRARVICASSAFLAKMVFDEVSLTRREAFVEHLLESLLKS